MERFLATVCTPDWNLALDRGASWDTAIAERVAAHPDQAHMIRAYRDRWTEMLAGPIEGTVTILRALHARGTPLYALTNWSAETWPHAERLYPFLSLFRGIMVSGHEGLVKPDPAIFRRLAERFDIAPGSVVFIDDNAKNAEAASALGIHAIRFLSPAQLRAALAGLGLIEAT